MIYIFSSFKKGAYTRPSDEVDPQLKTGKDWNKSWQEFIYSQYLMGQTTVRVDEQATIQDLRDYAAGRQDYTKYMDNYLGESKKPKMIRTGTDVETQYENLLESREGLFNINFKEFLAPIPGIVGNIVSALESADSDIVVSAIDEHSSSLRSFLKYQKLVDGEMQTFVDWAKVTMGVPTQTQPDQVLPKTMEELDMFDKMGTNKLPYEIGMKDGLTWTEKSSKIEKIKGKVLNDLTVIGKAAVFSYRDQGGVIKNRYIDIADTILENSMEEDGSDMSFGAVVLWMTIADLRPELDMSETDLQKYAIEWGRMYDNHPLYATESRKYTFFYDSYRVPVVWSFYKSNDSDYTTTLEDGRKFSEPWGEGGTKKPKVYAGENGKRKTEIFTRRNLYSSKWIMGTDIIWGEGPVGYLPFDYHTKDCRIPFIIYKILGSSPVERMIPIANQIAFCGYDLQNLRAQASPSGLSIEISSISKVKLGKRYLHPLDVVRIRRSTGDQLWMAQPADPNHPGASVPKPIDKISSGFPEDLAAKIKELEMYYMEMERVTRIADQATGQSPRTEQGKAVTENTMATTSNTLKPMFKGWLSIKQDISAYNAVAIQSVIVSAEGNNSPYYEILGPAKYIAIKAAGGLPACYWGFSFEPQLDPTYKTKVLDAAAQALAVGKDGVPILTVSEYTFILKIVNKGGSLDEVMSWIKYREEQATKAANDRADHAKVIEGQVNEKLAKSKAEDDLKQMKAKLDMQDKIDANKTERQKQLRILDHLFKMKEIEAMNAKQPAQA